MCFQYFKSNSPPKILEKKHEKKEKKTASVLLQSHSTKELNNVELGCLEAKMKYSLLLLLLPPLVPHPYLHRNPVFRGKQKRPKT
ncbi:hypothetical protein CEXT_738061 [Caerostris extrusa]|uniref:Uncharacterized protein n=1 Tax=Caerostris extrusa TaxID=172846 RepID=A0AAV4TAM1_CAEEX|nr:hypothetical protein CEXT_738061 [Caerostris extrusa]